MRKTILANDRTKLGSQENHEDENWQYLLDFWHRLGPIRQRVVDLKSPAKFSAPHASPIPRL
jgi:hypothetical protein